MTILKNNLLAQFKQLDMLRIRMNDQLHRLDLNIQAFITPEHHFMIAGTYKRNYQVISEISCPYELIFALKSVDVERNECKLWVLILKYCKDRTLIEMIEAPTDAVIRRIKSIEYMDRAFIQRRDVAFILDIPETTVKYYLCSKKGKEMHFPTTVYRGAWNTREVLSFMNTFQKHRSKQIL